jgi:hypothetical protein
VQKGNKVGEVIIRQLDRVGFKSNKGGKSAWPKCHWTISIQLE